MDIVPSIFKDYDVRGKVGTELNAETAKRIGMAFASFLPQQGAVAVGRDMRADSGELAGALIQGLRDMGRDVVDIGEVTSDMIYFAVGKLEMAGGAMVTASHNPGEFNGIKLCREEARPVGLSSGLDKVRDAAIANQFTPATSAGSLKTQDVREDWITHVLGFIEPGKLTPLRLGVDAGNGMAGAIFPFLEKHVPWQITELYLELDGTFPNHEANPMKFETLTDLIAQIKEKGLDGGVAFDGDGDRAFLLDETGTVLPGSVMAAMLGEYFLDKFPGSPITYDARVSHTVPDIIAAKGGTGIRTRVGHSNIKQAMREADASFGCEASGHFYFRDNWYADSGLIAAVIGLYVATLSGKKLSQLRQQYTTYASIPETNFKVDDKDAVIQRIADAFKDSPQDRLDGITVTLPDGWLNVRPSNTESVIRLNAESDTQSQLDQLVAKVTSLIAGTAA